jgi:membrane associated rhomboid family serine protease
MNRKAQFFPLKDDIPHQKMPLITWGIIAINVVLFIITYKTLETVIQTWGFIPAEFSFVTLLTSIFLHGGIAHILGNMWFLFIFGDNVEDKFGKVGFLIFYLLAGIVAGLSHLLLNLGSNIPAVGASGAISGVLGAYLVFYPNAGVYVTGGFAGAGRVSAKVMLLFWIGFQLFSALFLADQGIAFFAHIGGFFFGVIVALIWKKVKK